MTDLIQRLRESAKAARAIDRSALLEEAAQEIERMRSQPCPYVTGTVTRYCTLTPFTFTAAEREAFWFALAYAQNAGHECEATLRGLLERTK